MSGTQKIFILRLEIMTKGARCSSVVRAFAHGEMGCRIVP